MKNLNNLLQLLLESEIEFVLIGGFAGVVHGSTQVTREVTGVGDYNRLKSQAVEIEIFGQRCKVISIEDLIQSKEKMGRHKDKMTARELRALLVLKNVGPQVLQIHLKFSV